jgi:tetratricopeptide (TPR) repeat protein
MKNLYSLLFWFFPFCVGAQIVDTTSVVRQVDSLLKINNRLRKEGKFQEALPYAEASLDLAEKRLGRTHLRCGWAWNNLGMTYVGMGNYEHSESSFLKSLSIKQKCLGIEHDDCAMTMSNLANAYMDIGRFESAEPLYLKAKDIWEKLWGKAHIRYGWGMNNLGYLYDKMGLYETAAAYYLEALEIKGNALGKENDDYALTLSNLGNVYLQLGLLKSAEPLYLEARDIWGKVWGKDHIRYGWALNNLGWLYMHIESYETAEQFMLEALKVKENSVGAGHPDYATSLENLGVLYMWMGRFDAAEELLFKTQNIRTNILGVEHPDYKSSLLNLAFLYWKIGRFQDAEPLLLEASTLQRSLLLKFSRHLTERELSSHVRLLIKDYDQQFSFAHTCDDNNARLNIACFDNALFYKGFMLSAVSQMRHLALSDAASASLYELLTSYHRNLAQQYALPIAERSSSNIANLEAKANALEKELTAKVAGFGKAQRQVNWKEVQSKLQPGDAAVEFVHYIYCTPDLTDSVIHSALVLRPGDTAPHFVPLFEEKSLDSFLQTQGERRAEYVYNLYSIDE